MIVVILNILLVMIISYICGSFPTSIVVSKLAKGIDIRNYGSGNAGGTNVFRVLGWQYGILVSIVDIGKGVIATLLVSQIRIEQLSFECDMLFKIVAGLSAVIGHSFTVFAGFRGGKGVATGAGMLISLTPVVFIACLIIFALVLFSTGIVSVASITTAICFPIALVLYSVIRGVSIDQTLLIFSLVIPLFIIFTHRHNIIRIFRGQENKFEKIAIIKNLFKKRKIT